MNAQRQHTTPKLSSLFSSTQVGNNINADVKKLCNDFPDQEGEIANYSELTSLTSRPRGRRSLAELVTMVTGKEMDKDLGEGARSDWSNPDLSHDSLMYAITDALGGLVVWQGLEQKKKGISRSLGSLGTTEAASNTQGGGEPQAAADGEAGPGDPRVRPAEGDGQEGGGGGTLDLSSDLREEVEHGTHDADWLAGDDGDNNDGVEQVEVLSKDDDLHRSSPEVSRHHSGFAPSFLINALRGLCQFVYLLTLFFGSVARPSLSQNSWRS